MKINASQLSTMRELTGKLTALNGKENVEVELLEFDKKSKEKLAKAIISGNITRDVQDLFISSMVISSEGKEPILKGLSNWVKTQTGIAFVTNPPTRTRFKGDLETVIQIGEYMWAVRIELGNIEFEINEHHITNNEHSIIFDNVKAVIYPYGTYCAQVLGE